MNIKQDITLTISRDEAIAIMKFVGKSSPAGRSGLGLSEKENRFLSELYDNLSNIIIDEEE